MSTTRELTQDEIRTFVLPSHGDLATVKRMLAENPALLNTIYEEWKETPLGAASHVGNREIAEYLLSQGAPLTICTAAMLGRTESVADFIQSDPTQASATGAHAIPVLAHAAWSGKTEIADLLVANGGGEGVDDAVVNAAQSGHLDMARWLLERGANPNTTDFRGKTALAVSLERGHQAVADLLRQAGGQEA
ncbi:MAG: ankyrin repeat domain-containing protein [Chloroflexia bacterium]